MAVAIPGWTDRMFTGVFPGIQWREILKGPPLAGAMTDVRGAKCINCYQYLGSVVKGTRRKISQAHDKAKEVLPPIEHSPRRGSCTNEADDESTDAQFLARAPRVWTATAG